MDNDHIMKIALDDIENEELPEFLKEEIYHLGEPMKHFVSRG